ncbi:MAG: sigma-70 family RNA polymerase sigma factor [Solirubrobacteraceae bacterium]|nr:sigma-70 family RNA polymerase sigma factor [Solirubrobacteraceae bacterium]
MARDADDPRLQAEEAGLARRAADGDGSAFATLYDRYEQRIYTFCHRLVGTDEDAADATQDAFVKVLQRLPKLGDRDLNFGAYLYTAARNASYDVIGKRKRADAVDEIPEYGSQPVYGEQGDRLDLDPEGAAMLGSLQEQVRAANARLPERQREVLALRELEELSYDEIAEMMGMNRNSVAQLISRARIKLRDELRGSALASVAAATPDDERAASLIAERMDGELVDDEDREWLEDYLRDNERGRAMVECMLEAGTSYRAWLPIVPVVWLREATMAKAAESVGADWSAQAEAGRGGDGSGADGPSGQSGGADPGSGPGSGSGSGAGAGAGAAVGAGAAAGAAAAAGEAVAEGGRRRRAAVGGAIAGVLLLLILGAQLVLGGDDKPKTAAVVETVTTDEPAVTTATGGVVAQPATSTSEDKPKKKKKKKSDDGGGSSDAAPADTTTPNDAAQVTEASVPASSPKKSSSNPSSSQKKTSSGNSNAKSGDGSGSSGSSGSQGEGSAPLPDEPATPAPQPDPEQPTPPVETTPAPATPTTPSRPCRPAAGRPC